MTKKEWQQYSFLAPVHQDIGIIPKHPRHRKKPGNPDLAAVNRFLGRQRRALYDETGQTPLPNPLSLTPHQLRIYYAIQASAAKEAKEDLGQRRAESAGLTKEIFYLDQEVPLAQTCQVCERLLVRYAITERIGRQGKRRDQYRLLVNDYCSSCGFTETGKEYHFWVSDSQIIKRQT